MRFLRGDTQRLTAEIYDFDGLTLIDPDLIKIVIYNTAFSIVQTLPMNSDNRISIGNFFCYWTPLIKGTFILEWYCEKNDMQSIYREKVSIEDVF